MGRILGTGARLAILSALSLAACAVDEFAILQPRSVELWTPPAIQSEQFESHPAIDPRTGDLWFVRSTPRFTGWRLWVAPCGRNGWETPHEAPFGGNGVDADPWFTPDGATLWFISSRSSDDDQPHSDTDIWRVRRDDLGRWAHPERLPAPVNSASYEWFPHLAPDGWLYFGSGRPGGKGGNDVWRARFENGAWRAENLGDNINTQAGEFEPLPSPDGRFLFVEADDGLYVSKRARKGWGRKVRLGSAVNVNGTEIGAALSPSGRTLLFSRDTKGAQSGELFRARFGAAERWPQCPLPANLPASQNQSVRHDAKRGSH